MPTLAPLLAAFVPVTTQDYVEILSSGELTTYNGAVVRIDTAATDRILCLTDHADPLHRQAVFHPDGGWYLHTGVWTVEGRLIEHVTSLTGPHQILDLVGGTQVLGYYNYELLVTGAPVAGLGLPPGSELARLDFVTNDGRLLLRGVVHDPAAGDLDFLLAGRPHPTGLEDARVVALEGVEVGGLGPVVSLYANPASVSAIGSKRIAWTGIVDVAGVPQSVCFRRGQLVAREGQPAPFPGRSWGRFEDPRVNQAQGHWTLVARLDDSDPATAPVIVRDGYAFRQAGETLPAIAPWKLTGFGDGPAIVDSEGRVLWYGRFDHPDASRDEALFLDETPLIREGVTVLAGERVVGFGERPLVYDMTEVYVRVLVRVDLESGRHALFGMVLDSDTYFCLGGKNSLQVAARLSLRGFRSIELDALSARADDLPAHEPVILLASDHVQMSTFGNTALCISDNPLRVAVGDSGPHGVFEADVDLDTMRASGMLQAGESWFFQAWYRDSLGSPAFNLTEGMRWPFE